MKKLRLEYYIFLLVETKGIVSRYQHLDIPAIDGVVENVLKSPRFLAQRVCFCWRCFTVQLILCAIVFFFSLGRDGGIGKGTEDERKILQS